MKSRKFEYRFMTHECETLITIERRYINFPLRLLGWNYAYTALRESAKQRLEELKKKDNFKPKIVEL